MKRISHPLFQLCLILALASVWSACTSPRASQGKDDLMVMTADTMVGLSQRYPGRR